MTANDERITIRSDFFYTVEGAMIYLVTNELVPQERICNSCGLLAPIKKYTNRGNESIVYRCVSCSKRKSLYSLCTLQNCKISPPDILLYCYFYILV
jgi:hypothetical protein